MQNYLAIDAGGTSTRAVLVMASGDCLGYGVSGGGNPVSRGFDGAVDAQLRASATALGGSDAPLHSVTVAMAGASLELPVGLFRERFAALGLLQDVVIESDLLGTFYSGSHQDDGYALIAGTGAVAARVAGSQLAAVADGTGWLLGDNGAGFWLGREVVRAVAAALDGREQATALTELLLAELAITADRSLRTQGRVGAQQQLIAKTYGLAPIELSRFAPLVFEAVDDAVARDIIDRAAAALARTLLAVTTGREDGPLVFGGSVLTKGGTVAAAVMAELALHAPAGSTGAVPVLVRDGVVGAAVLALKRHGVVVDAAVFGRITSSLAALRD
ncbi:N-acetylglucosamine kinase [Arthrobacter livingstonensis]|nr:BadF/BadG/BcrA/BcrD ATPase family protein [Arthrobacter livingstonensis]